MSNNVDVWLKEKGTTTITVNKLPDTCPICHKLVDPNPMAGSLSRSSWGHDTIQIAFRCPSSTCNSVFVGYYNQHQIRGGEGYWYWIGVSLPTFPNPSTWSDTIKSMSEEFVQTYGEADMAEQSGWMRVAGVGYRRALEFLVKDYAIKTNPPEKHDGIKSTLLGVCINNYIDDVRIKKVAERAAWLGNDETHYIRKWEDKDVTDLKQLIKVTADWIEIAVITEEAIETMKDMPRKKK
jgi:hypothetical protein